MTVARRFTVRGEVQGVGFRWAAREEAVRLGLVGTIRNLRDGAVEAQAQGEPDAVDAFAAWLARGPRWAQVSEVTTEEVPPLSAGSFEVRSDR
jgi:acylphosphatase